MNIGLIDVDGHNFPNLCLMKLSSFFKQKGYKTKLLKPEDVLLGENIFEPFDKYYAACVFSSNANIALKLAQIGTYIGGTGLNNYIKTYHSYSSKKHHIFNNLPRSIENIMPDYELYDIDNTAYGFLTRGCPRGCPFCLVSMKEGLISKKVANLNEFWSGQSYIKLLDPNLLASSDHIELLNQLRESNAWIDFTQGLDVRLVNENNVALLNSLKIKMIHLAWDNPRDNLTKKALLKFKKLININDYRKLRVYVLCNYWSTHKEDLYRVYWLREHGYDPYIMIYNKNTAPIEARYLQRWVNNKRIFRTINNFSDYDHQIG